MGVRMICATGTAHSSIKKVITTPMMAKRTMLAPMIFPASSGFPSPSLRPRSTVVPMAIPTTNEVISCISQLPVETAETSAAVANRPTTSISTAPYIVCKNNAASTGSANRTREVRIFPFVKFCVSFISSVPLFLYVYIADA